MFALPHLFGSFMRPANRKTGDFLGGHFSSWKRWMATHPCWGTLAHASEYRHASQEATDQSRNLPWKASSTVWLISLLSKCAFASCGEGGWQDDSHRLKARHVLNKLLKVAAHGKGWKLHLCYDNNAQQLGFNTKPTGRIALTCMPGRRLCIFLLRWSLIIMPAEQFSHGTSVAWSGAMQW